MLRNDKIIRLIKEKLSRKEESNTFSNYPRANYNDHESDDDESSDESSDDGELIHDRLFKNNSENEKEKSERKSVYLRGLCKLNTNYPEYTSATTLCYQIKHINGFPVLLFKLYKAGDTLGLYKVRKFLDNSELSKKISKQESFYKGYLKTRTDTILFYNVREYDDVEELTRGDYYWVAPCEILNQQRVFHYSIGVAIRDFFLEHKDFLYIESEEKEVFHSSEIGYQNNVSETQFMLGPILSKTNENNTYQYDYFARAKANVGRDLIINVDTFTSEDSFGIADLNQRIPLAYLSA